MRINRPRKKVDRSKESFNIAGLENGHNIIATRGEENRRVYTYANFAGRNRGITFAESIQTAQPVPLVSLNLISTGKLFLSGKQRRVLRSENWKSSNAAGFVDETSFRRPNYRGSFIFHHSDYVTRTRFFIAT